MRAAETAVRSSWRIILALILLAAAALTCGALVPHSPDDLRELALAAGVAAPVLVLSAWLVLTPALFPGTLLSAASGLALGPLTGSAIAVTGLSGGLGRADDARRPSDSPSLRGGRLPGQSPLVRRGDSDRGASPHRPLRGLGRSARLWISRGARSGGGLNRSRRGGSADAHPHAPRPSWMSGVVRGSCAGHPQRV